LKVRKKELDCLWDYHLELMKGRNYLKELH
jgi:hypothetical protein